MSETVKKGKTVEEAIALALEELGIDREDAQIEILDEGNKGIFGIIGSKEAEVRVSCKDNSNKEKADDYSHSSFDNETHSKAKEYAEEFLGALFEKMGIDVKIDITEEDGRLDINFSGDRMGLLIGRRGETLMAIQYLTSLAVNRKSEDYVSVSVDTENYKEKREETLIKLARKTADKAIKYRRSFALDPMSPYERRIIHSCLQGYGQINTYSKGEDPNRRVVISYNKESIN